MKQCKCYCLRIISFSNFVMFFNVFSSVGAGGGECGVTSAM